MYKKTILYDFPLPENFTSNTSNTHHSSKLRTAPCSAYVTQTDNAVILKVKSWKAFKPKRHKNASWWIRNNTDFIVIFSLKNPAYPRIFTKIKGFALRDISASSITAIDLIPSGGCDSVFLENILQLLSSKGIQTPDGLSLDKLFLYVLFPVLRPHILSLDIQPRTAYQGCFLKELKTSTSMSDFCLKLFKTTSPKIEEKTYNLLLQGSSNTALVTTKILAAFKAPKEIIEDFILSYEKEKYTFSKPITFKEYKQIISFLKRMKFDTYKFLSSLKERHFNDILCILKEWKQYGKIGFKIPQNNQEFSSTREMILYVNSVIKDISNIHGKVLYPVYVDKYKNTQKARNEATKDYLLSVDNSIDISQYSKYKRATLAAWKLTT